MTNTLTTLPAVPEITVDYSPINAQVDRIIASEGIETVIWVGLADMCSAADDSAAAWIAAREHYIASYPKGKNGKATNPGNTFKSRKSDVLCVRKAHPKMSADSIVQSFGSFRSLATAIRAASAEPKVPAAPVAVTVAERLADITAAIRLAMRDGAAADDIHAAIVAAAGTPASDAAVYAA